MKKNTLLLLAALAGTAAHAAPRPAPGFGFEENKAQWPAAARYRALVPGGAVWLRATGFTYSWANQQDLARTAKTATPARPLPALRVHAVLVDFEGAAATQPVGQRPAEAYTNYFVGNDPRRWADHVRSFAEVRYPALYPGIDLRVYGTAQGQLEYDLCLAPGANLAGVRLRYRGATTLRVLPNGTLAVGTSVGEVREQRPVAYQLGADGRRQPVPCRYHLAGTTVTFELPAGYDRSRALVVDPVVQAASYVGVPGQNGSALARTATYDGQGNMYVAGVAAYLVANTSAYPTTPGAYVVPQGEITISKLNPTGTALLYSTHLGGTQPALGRMEEPSHLACDAAGNLLVYGFTTSTDFPTLATSYDRTLNGQDVFVAKLSPTGSALLASTYLGGSGDETTFTTGDLRVDAAGAVYVAGTTDGTGSRTFPTTAGAYIGTAPASRRSFVAHLDPQLTTLR